VRWIIPNLKTDHIRRIAASELPNAGGALIGLLCAMSGLPTSTWSECGLRPQNVKIRKRRALKREAKEDWGKRR
jgi:hypothetical protein